MNDHAESKKISGSELGSTSSDDGKGPKREKDPRRVAAGRRNRKLRRGLSPGGRQRLREAALANRPWRFATGPKTAEGKARSAANGCWQQKGSKSLRQVRRELADLVALANQMAQMRRQVRDVHTY